MAKTGMSNRVDVGGHYEPSKAPSLNKGQFQQVGTFIDENDMTTVMPKGTSVNSKTGTMQTGEKP
jgi:hypothetical protein